MRVIALGPISPDFATASATEREIVLLCACLSPLVTNAGMSVRRPAFRSRPATHQDDGLRRRRCRSFLCFVHLVRAAAAGHDLCRLGTAFLAIMCRLPFDVFVTRTRARLVKVEVDLLARLRPPVIDLAEIVELALETCFQEGLETSQQVASALSAAGPWIGEQRLLHVENGDSCSSHDPATRRDPSPAVL